MAIIQDLWSELHERNLERFLRAVEEEEPLEVLVALDFGEFGALDAAVDAALDGIRGAQTFGMAMGAAAQIAIVVEQGWGIQLDAEADIRHEGSLTHAFENKAASPRTLAALWAYLAKRAGMKAHWLEMSVFHPLWIADDESEVLVDTTSGALVTRKDCEEIFAAITDGEEVFESAMFDRPSARDVANDTLELRLAAATTADDEVSAWQAMRFHAELNRDKPAIVFAAAMAASALGEYVYAGRELKRLAVECAGSSLEEPVRQALERLALRREYAN